MREAEAAAYATWEEATRAAEAAEEAEAAEAAEAAAIAETGEEAIEAPALPEKPELAAGLEIANVEFVREDGTALIYDLAAETWGTPEA